MNPSFRYTVILLGVFFLLFFSSGCSNNTKKFAEISNGFSKSINQLGKEPGITLTGFASDPNKNLFKVGIGIDRNTMTNERLKQVIQSFLINAASYTSEHDPKKMLEPYNLQIEVIAEDRSGSWLIAEKPSGSTEISWIDKDIK